MNKILLIIRREFLTRVRKRTFIIGTILFPVLYLGLIFGTGYIADKTKENLKVSIIDNTHLITDSLIEEENKTDPANILSLLHIPESIAKTTYDSLGYNGYITF